MQIKALITCTQSSQILVKPQFFSNFTDWYQLDSGTIVSHLGSQDHLIIGPTGQVCHYIMRIALPNLWLESIVHIMCMLVFSCDMLNIFIKKLRISSFNFKVLVIVGDKFSGVFRIGCTCQRFVLSGQILSQFIPIQINCLSMLRFYSEISFVTFQKGTDC